MNALRTSALARALTLAAPLLLALLAVHHVDAYVLEPAFGAGVVARTALRLIAGAAMLALYAACVRILERRPASELGRRSVGLLAPGAAIGTSLFCLVAAFLLLAGHARCSEPVLGWTALPILAQAAFAAAGEEVVFRGAVYRVLDERWGTGVALVLSATLFGALHASNEGATPAGVAGVALEAGVLLGLAYSLTSSLWLPIGIHLGWNFAEGGLFGTTVSGGTSSGILTLALSGGPLWTGGRFGPEASVPAMAICLAASCAMVVLVVRSGRWRRSLPSAAFRRAHPAPR